MGSDNHVVCDLWAIDEAHRKFGYRREIVFERGCLLTRRHWVDVVDRVRIGAGSIVAGVGSQFWTHGFSGNERDIDIGGDCYVGTASIFTPGSGVADHSIVGAGSTVTRKHAEPYTLISGNPAEIRRSHYCWRTRSPAPSIEGTVASDLTEGR
jgi:acetyltransferase-like isoleucine patch superfamily enzyme